MGLEIRNFACKILNLINSDNNFRLQKIYLKTASFDQIAQCRSVSLKKLNLLVEKSGGAC